MNHTGGNNYTYHLYHGQLFTSHLQTFQVPIPSINNSSVRRRILCILLNVNPFSSMLTQPFRHVALIISSLPHPPLPRSNLLRNPFPPGLDDLTGTKYSFNFHFQQIHNTPSYTVAWWKIR